MKAQLILENGMRFSGTLFGAEKNIVGEVVFTTGMTGYQETLTDPSFAGQIVTMTFPLIGNYGINLEDMEAKHTNLKAFVVREKCDFPSNFRNEMNLDDFLRQQGVVGIEGEREGDGGWSGGRSGEWGVECVLGILKWGGMVKGSGFGGWWNG